MDFFFTQMFSSKQNAMNSEPQKMIPASPSVYTKFTSEKKNAIQFWSLPNFSRRLDKILAMRKTSETWSFTVKQDRFLSLEDLASEKEN